MNVTALRLNLACGSQFIRRPGWLNIDLAPLAADVKALDIRSLDGIEAGSVAEIVCSHALEHLEDPAAALRRWYEVLQPGGVLLIAVPDQDQESVWIGIHLQTLRERGENPLEDHHAEFTPRSLREAVDAAGDWASVEIVDPLMHWQLPGKGRWQACVRAVKGGEA